MIAWTTQDASRARLALQLLLKYVQDAGLIKIPSILSVTQRTGAEDLLGRILKKFKTFSYGQLNQRSLVAGANKRLCAHCSSRFLFGNGSLCKTCKEKLGREGVVKYKQLKYKTTCLRTLGRPNVFSGKAGAEVSRLALLASHGVENANDIPGVRDRINKKLKKSGMRRARMREATLMREHGETHWTRIKYYTDGFKARLQAEHGEGVTNVMHIADVKAKHQAAIDEVDWDKVQVGVRRSTMKSWGVDNIFKNVAFMQQSRLAATGCIGPWSKSTQAKYKEEHGVRHCMQRSDVFEKMVVSSYLTKTAKSDAKIVGRSDIFQGYELSVVEEPQRDDAVEFIRTGVNVPKAWYYHNGEECAYEPDLGVQSKSGYRCVVEVKSDWTLFKRDDNTWRVNYLKFRAADKRFNGQFFLAVPVKKTWYLIRNPAAVMK